MIDLMTLSIGPKHCDIELKPSKSNATKVVGRL